MKNNATNPATNEIKKQMGIWNNGFFQVLFLIAFTVVAIFGIIWMADQPWMLTEDGHTSDLLGLPISIAAIIFSLWWNGFMIVKPNLAVVLTFFGKYVGTVKETGFFWVNPLCGKGKISCRINNMDVEPIKVNDKTGNPIMIGMVLVWKIEDTYKASFNVEDQKNLSRFVSVQGASALRKVAGFYAYDNIDNHAEEITLRANSEVVTKELEEELRNRLMLAGISVVEARINYLAYATEIAGVMLKRQQADAIISAREKIVEGAVSMVDLALKKLEKDNVVLLDDERKAAMVSNLLVVLCGDEGASPVINAGTIY